MVARAQRVQCALSVSRRRAQRGIAPDEPSILGIDSVSSTSLALKAFASSIAVIVDIALPSSARYLALPCNFSAMTPDE